MFLKAVMLTAYVAVRMEVAWSCSLLLPLLPLSYVAYCLHFIHSFLSGHTSYTTTPFSPSHLRHLGACSDLGSIRVLRSFRLIQYCGIDGKILERCVDRKVWDCKQSCSRVRDCNARIGERGGMWRVDRGGMGRQAFQIAHHLREHQHLNRICLQFGTKNWGRLKRVNSPSCFGIA